MLKYDSIEKQLVDRKTKIDRIVARYNKTVSLQNCKENLGLLTSILTFTIIYEDKIDTLNILRQ